MGFFGTVMLIRADVDLETLPAVVALGGTLDAAWTGEHGWRFARVYDGKSFLPAGVRAVAEQTGAPFLAAYVVDSDFAIVQCAAPSLPEIQFVLNPACAADYDYPVDPAVQEAAVRYLLDFAGGRGDAARIRAVVEDDLTFAEEAVPRLAAALGAGSVEDPDR
ncbi:hypothetical protein ACWT_3961 [Actinoplanes sp. SE50]|uniref:hypothetical protein n=1 Tax=unclassified Actinoplanes TaxID=2626549 RepID=UPI00023ED44D|nr:MULTISPECIES: hypothetical protein [unclassified Actinoplanes]AEV84985.1 hypothetical protein ACPL_4090 [Actinoplanes sp. SE50/110]ATO83376.1 hypothetical protein ACWT_3961 [Actinoplanes sp. SE50]SLM00783.1 hypothetical protein ACSP50_4016 [Actinoplanes sp. SE50/110]